MHALRHTSSNGCLKTNRLCVYCRYLEDRMGWAISHIWHLVTQDIENTLNDVGSKVVHDKGVDDLVQHRRAEALYEISHIFGVRDCFCRMLDICSYFHSPTFALSVQHADWCERWWHDMG